MIKTHLCRLKNLLRNIFLQHLTVFLNLMDTFLFSQENLSLKISPEFLIFDENNEIEMVLQNNTKGSNNSIMKQNQTMDEFSFENLLSKGKNYFFLMKSCRINKKAHLLRFFFFWI